MWLREEAVCLITLLIHYCCSVCDHFSDVNAVVKQIDDKCYYGFAYEQRKTYPNAKAACELANTHLLWLETEDETQKVGTLFGGDFKQGYIGIEYIKKIWYWVDSQDKLPVDDLRFDTSDFRPDKPRGYTNDMENKMSWSESQTDAERTYICEAFGNNYETRVRHDVFKKTDDAGSLFLEEMDTFDTDHKLMCALYCQQRLDCWGIGIDGKSCRLFKRSVSAGVFPGSYDIYPALNNSRIPY